MRLILLALCLISTLSFAGKSKRLKDVFIVSETYPRPELTPGDIDASLTKEDVCSHGFAKKARNVSKNMKRKIKVLYELSPKEYSSYIIDHFIPLSLGGTNNATNLWPQRLKGIVYGADEKAKADNYLFAQVCSGEIDLDNAQNMIKEDWVLVYKQCCEKEDPKVWKKSKPEKKFDKFQTVKELIDDFYYLEYEFEFEFEFISDDETDEE